LQVALREDANMGTKHVNQRLVILCDADNLEIAQDDSGRRLPINHRKLLRAMNGRELVRAIYFRPTRNFSVQAQRFLESSGFEVRRTWKNSDAWIAAEAFALASKCDVIAFVGGDGDLEPLIMILKAHGVRVEVWSWSEKASARVRDLVDVFVPLREELLFEERGASYGEERATGREQQFGGTFPVRCRVGGGFYEHAVPDGRNGLPGVPDGTPEDLCGRVGAVSNE
jgi:uncharacterized LabA/DUF88 family protein